VIVAIANLLLPTPFVLVHGGARELPAEQAGRLGLRFLVGLFVGYGPRVAARADPGAAGRSAQPLDNRCWEPAVCPRFAAGGHAILSCCPLCCPFAPATSDIDAV
jgi:hypothetical protein